jgi:hypothetical protein
MSDALLEVEIVNKVTNLGAFAEEKAAMQGALGSGGGITGGGLQTQNAIKYGSQLTRQEEAYAAAQLSSFAATEKAAGGFKAYETKLKDAVIVSGQAGSVTDGLARKMSALGSLGITPATAGLLAAVVGLGLFVAAAKSAAENADKNEASIKGLEQAYATIGRAVPTKMIDDFIGKNRGLISSEYEAKDAFAAAARAGFDQNMQLRLMGDALNLAAIKNIPLSEAMTMLIKASTGNSRALTDLGISAKQVSDPLKELARAHKEVAVATGENDRATRTLLEWEVKHTDRAKLTASDLMHEADLKVRVSNSTDKLKKANQDLAGALHEAKDKGDKFHKMLDLLEPKIAGGTGKITDLKNSQNALNTESQKFGDKTGPLITGSIKDLTGAASAGLGILNTFVDLIGKLNSMSLQNVAWLLSQASGAAPAGSGAFGLMPHKKKSDGAAAAAAAAAARLRHLTST